MGAMRKAVAMVFVTAPLGAALLFALLIFLVRRPKYASLAKSMLGIGIITAVVNTAIGVTVNFGHGGFVMLFLMPAWGFYLGALGTVVAWLPLSQLQLTMRGWKLLGACLLLLAIAVAVPFDTVAVPPIRLALVDSSGSPVASACVREYWSYQLLEHQYEGDEHLAGADGRVSLPARIVHASAMSRVADLGFSEELPS